jgi:hypothetical protein
VSSREFALHECVSSRGVKGGGWKGDSVRSGGV